MTGSIFNSSFHAPGVHTVPLGVLFPTDPAYSEADYEAVMKSREALRIWSDSEWPADDFTLAENTADLQGHVEDNEAHEAYGYMIFSPDRTTCFGSVYLNPLVAWRDRYDLLAGDEAAIDQVEVRVDHWLRSDRPDLEAPVLEVLRDWLRTAWPVRPVFVVRPRMTARLATCRAAGMQWLGHLRNREFGAELLLYADSPARMGDEPG